MDDYRRIGFLGAAVLATGTMCPLVSLPIVGSVSYLANGAGDGQFMLGFAAIIALATWLGWRYLAMVAVVLSGFLLLLAYGRMQSALAEMRADLADNPFAGLVAATVQLQWGWLVMLAGIVLSAIAASRMPRPRLLSRRVVSDPWVTRLPTPGKE